MAANEDDIATADHASGALVDGSPKWTFIPVNTSVPPCVKFVQKPVTHECETKCSYSGGTFYGAVPCVKDSDGETTDDVVCTFWEHVKPAPLSKTCPSTPTCVEWATSQPTSTCPAQCGQPASTLHGRVFCKETQSGLRVADAKCEYWKQDKPTVPQQNCPATPSCTASPTPRPTPYPTRANLYRRSVNGHSWGGYCQCPNGVTYAVSDSGNACRSLSCHGGRTLSCNRNGGPWSHAVVWCGQGELSEDVALYANEVTSEDVAPYANSEE